MANAGAATVLITPVFSGFQRSINRQLGAVGGRAAQNAGQGVGRSLMSGIRRAATIGGGIAAAIGLRNLGSAAVESATGIQNTAATLGGMLGSAEDARDTMARLREVARTSPIEYQTYLAAGESLAYLGVSGEQAEGILRNVGAAITAAGGSSQQMDSVSQSLLTMVNTGTVYANELNRISDAGVPIFSGLAEHFGTNIENVREMVSAGEVGIEDVLSTIENAEGDTFQNMLDASDAASKTLSNQWEIAKDNITTTLGEQMLPVIEGLTPAMQTLAERGPALVGGLFSGIGGAVQAVLPYLRSFGEFLIDTVWPAVQQVAQWVMGSLVPALWDLGSAVGSAVLPVIQSLGDFLMDTVVPAVAAFASEVGGQIVASLRSLAEWVSENRTLVAGLAAAVVGAVAAIGTMRIITTAVTWLKGMRTAMIALNVAMRANPILMIVGLLGALVGAIIYAWNNSETFRDVVTSVWRAIQNAVRTAWERFIEPVISWFVARLQELWSVAQTAGRWIVSAWNAIRDGLGAAWRWIDNNVIAPIGAAFNWVWTRAVRIKDGVVGAWRSLRDGVHSAYVWMRDNVLEPVIGWFQSAWDKAVEVKDGIVSAWSTVASSIGEAFDGIWDGIKSALNTVFGFINTWMISPLNKVLDPFDLAIPELPKLHSGGMVPGEGEKPYMLLGGEAVLNPAATKALGPEVIDALNKGEGFGGWPDWLSWDRVKQAMAVGTETDVGTGFTSGVAGAGRGLLGAIKAAVEEALDFLSPKKDNSPTFAWGSAIGTAENLGEAVIDWASIGHEGVAKRIRSLPKGGSPDFDGDTAFPLPRGSYRVGVPINGYPGHTGQDFPAPVGTPVFAPFSGQFQGRSLGNRSYGTYANVMAGGLRFIGAHLSRLVGANRFVQAGEQIGAVGSTGNSTGPHLHAEFRQGGSVRDPRNYLSFDRGGYIPPGVSGIVNQTRNPEPVLTSGQWDAVSALAGRGAAMDPDAIGDAVRAGLSGARIAVGSDGRLEVALSEMAERGTRTRERRGMR